MLGTEKPTADGGAGGVVPVPPKDTVCVLPGAPLLLSVMVRAPVSGPVVVGANATSIVHEAAAARLPLQLLVALKLALVAMLVKTKRAFPVLLKVSG